MAYSPVGSGGSTILALNILLSIDSSESCVVPTDEPLI